MYDSFNTSESGEEAIRKKTVIKKKVRVSSQRRP